LRGSGQVSVLFIVCVASSAGCVHRASDAKAASAKSDIATLDSAVANFKLDCGRYPTSAEGLAALVRSPKGLEKTWRGPYVMRVPAVDPWGAAYEYRSAGPKFQIKSLGSGSEILGSE
jgi:general secretion pathway protein G